MRCHHQHDSYPPCTTEKKAVSPLYLLSLRSLYGLYHFFAVFHFYASLDRTVKIDRKGREKRGRCVTKTRRLELVIGILGTLGILGP